MGSRKFEVGLVLAIVAIVVVMVFRAFGQGGDSNDGKAVASSEVRQALNELPYSYRFRDASPSGDAVSAVAGTARGPGGAVVHFGAAFGHSPDPVPLPGEGAAKALELEEGVITTREGNADNPSRRTGNSQSQTADRPGDADQMAAQLATTLCRAAGETSCPENGSEENGGKEPPSGKSEPEFRTIDQGRLDE